MGGRGAYSQRRGGAIAPRRDATLNAGGGGSAGGDSVAISSVVGSASFPQIANFGDKNIVNFNYKLSKDGSITIKDDKGRVFKGTYAGHGASRDTFGFKEGFVIKFDGLKDSGFGTGSQTRAEVKAYKNINKALVRPAGQTPRGKERKGKARVPDLVAAYLNQKITLPNGRVRNNVAVSIMSKAKGGHDTGVKADSPKGRNLIKRVEQYFRALSKRGVNTEDFSVYGRNGTVKLHNIYRDKKNGRLTIVDLGI